jgi:hypothetical protein
MNVIVNLRAAKRAEQCAGSDPLIKSPVFVGGEPLNEFVLTNEDNLERVAVRRVGIEQESQFLQGFVTQSLRLVKQQYHPVRVYRIGQERFESLKNR